VVYEDDPRLLDLEKNMKKVKVAKVDQSKKEDDYITLKEFEKLIKKIPQRYALIVEALFWTGCRVSELINIKLKDCKRNKGIYTITIVGKGSKQRDVFMTEVLYKKLIKEFESSVYLFEHNSKKFSRSYISDTVKRYGLKILDRDISAHTLRHSKAMYLKDVQKLSPDQIQKALGHADVRTTLTHYYHGTPSAADQGIK
jgi:integrase